MSAFGTSRHSAAAAEFGRYRGMADTGNPSARQIYGFTAWNGRGCFAVLLAAAAITFLAALCARLRIKACHGRRGIF
jgi:hypothetical protein